MLPKHYVANLTSLSLAYYNHVYGFFIGIDIRTYEN